MQRPPKKWSLLDPWWIVWFEDESKQNDGITVVDMATFYDEDRARVYYEEVKERPGVISATLSREAITEDAEVLDAYGRI